MREQLEYFHRILGACQAVAGYLGYTLRGYMKIRHKVLNGLALPPRVEDLLRLKAEQLASENNKNEGVASVTNHSNNGLTNGQKEFNKALKRIKTMFQAGKSRKDIHAKLTEAGRISLSYPRFCVLVAKANESDPFIAIETGKGCGQAISKHSSSARNGRTGRSVKRPSTR